MQNLAETLSEGLAEDLAKPEPAMPRIRPVEATKEENQIAALFRAGEHILRDRRHKLAQLEQSYRQRLIDIEVEHSREVAQLRAEIALLSNRLGFGP